MSIDAQTNNANYTNTGIYVHTVVIKSYRGNYGFKKMAEQNGLNSIFLKARFSI